MSLQTQKDMYYSIKASDDTGRLDMSVFLVNHQSEKTKYPIRVIVTDRALTRRLFRSVLRSVGDKECDPLISGSVVGNIAGFPGFTAEFQESLKAVYIGIAPNRSVFLEGHFSTGANLKTTEFTI